MLRFENQDKANYLGVGKYEIPLLQGIQEIDNIEWIPFNYALSCKEPENKGIHFYVDDYQFQRVWNDIDKYTQILMRFKAVMTP